MLVLELVITIAAVEHASISALRFIPALTASGQLGSPDSSITIRSAPILLVLPVACASDLSQMRAHILFITSEHRDSHAIQPRGPGVAPACRLAQPGASQRAAATSSTCGSSSRRPCCYRRLSRELSDWHSHPRARRNLAQQKTNMDERRRTVSEYKAWLERSVATL